VLSGPLTQGLWGLAIAALSAQDFTCGECQLPLATNRITALGAAQDMYARHPFGAHDRGEELHHA
jgi:hypothetical protein